MTLAQSPMAASMLSSAGALWDGAKGGGGGGGVRYAFFTRVCSVMSWIWEKWPVCAFRPLSPIYRPKINTKI